MMNSMLVAILLSISVQVSAAPPLYSTDSPWNQPIPEEVRIDPHSSRYVAAMNGVFGSRTDKYTFAVYRIDTNTSLVPIRINYFWSEVSGQGERLQVTRDTQQMLPIPPGALAARGRDAQLVLWDPETGDEWGLYHAKRTSLGWEADNGYHYNTRWNGVPPKGFVSRGAGVPYLTGLILPREIEAGVIEHALALGLNFPSPLSIYPATKSDGRGNVLWSLPMGSRLQLDPKYTEDDFTRWGLDRSGRIVARALQRFGMILIDGSDHPKIYAEYDGTADWQGRIRDKTVRPIPYNAFRVVLMPGD